jgi:hypothetical protein
LEVFVDHVLPWLKYVDASDIPGDKFYGTRVESPTREILGHVEGFIVDSESARPYYVVVDAGGWFKSKHFLLPVGHVAPASDPSRQSMIADLSKSRVNRLPGFDRDEFEKMTPDAWKLFNDTTCKACSVTAVIYSALEPPEAAWNRADYAYPDWWTAQPTRPDRMAAGAFKEMADYEAVPKISRPDPATRERERMVAAHRSDEQVESDREMRETGEPSPHYGGRAQPGDVIGIETGGESTSIGDTTNDENARRKRAEKNAPRR